MVVTLGQQYNVGEKPTVRTGRLNPSRETKFSGTHGDRGIFLPCSADHEQDWQPYPVDPYSATCDDHTYMRLIRGFRNKYH